MKLKKIAALALAGVLAVSMLAGCGDNSSNGNNVVVTPGTSSIVAAFNDGQDADNDVKITFSSDATLDNVVKKVIEKEGTDFTETEARQLYAKMTGKGASFGSNGAATPYTDFTSVENTESRTVLYTKSYDGETYWSENDAVKAAGRDVDAVIADLKASTKKDTTVGKKYVDFSYTGNVTMVKVEDVTGTVEYVVVYTITRTGTEVELKA